MYSGMAISSLDCWWSLAIESVVIVRPRASDGGRARSSSPERRASAAPRARSCSDRQLIANRQLADPLAGRGEDRVAERGRDRRHAGLTHTAHRRVVVAAGDDVHPDDARGAGHTYHLVGIEVVLLDPPGLVADLAERGAEAHDDGALHLGPHPIRIDRGPTVDCDIDARDRD